MSLPLPLPGTSVRVPTEFWSSSSGLICFHSGFLAVALSVRHTPPPETPAQRRQWLALQSGSATSAGHAARRVVGRSGEGDHAGLGRVLRRAVELPLRPVDQQPSRVREPACVAGGDPVEGRACACDDLGRNRLGRIRPALRLATARTRSALHGRPARRCSRRPHRLRLPSDMIPRPGPEDFPASRTSVRATAAANRKNEADTTPVRVLVIDSPPSRCHQSRGKPPRTGRPAGSARGLISAPRSGCQATIGRPRRPRRPTQRRTHRRSRSRASGRGGRSRSRTECRSTREPR